MNETNHSTTSNISRVHHAHHDIPQPDCTLSVAKLFPFAFLIVVTNGIVFALFLSRKKLRSPSNLLLLSLAASDFLTGALNIPLFLVLLCGQGSMAMSFFISVLHNFTATSCAFHILAITAEKYVAITRPLQHHSISRRTVAWMIAGVWFVAFLIAFMPFVWYSKLQEPKVMLVAVIHAGFCLLVVFLLPYIYMVYAHVVMFKAINGRIGGRLRLLKGTPRQDFAVHRKVRNEHKCLIVFASMAVIFAVCWLPWFVITLIIRVLSLDPPPDIDKMPPEVVYIAFLMIRYLSSISNPLLYTFFKRDFWKAFKHVTMRNWRGISSHVSLATMRRGSAAMLVGFRRRSKMMTNTRFGMINRSEEIQNELINHAFECETQYVSAV